MRQIIAAILTACGVIAIAVIAWRFSPSKSNQMSKLDAASSIANKEVNWQRTSDGAASYMAQLALAHSELDRGNPLSSYRPTAGIAGRNLLDEIYANGVPVTPGSAFAIRKLLSDGKLSRDEMIAIPRLLAALHNGDNSTGANADIEFELKKLVGHSDKQIAAQAAIQYARMGYLPETESVLKNAFERGVLTEDSYYQELAHLVSSAPAEKQPELMAVIRESSNRMASDVLANALLTGEEFNAASFLRSSPDMAELLRSTEPQFSDAAGQFGLVDAVRYSQWLRAIAIIESERTGRSVDDLILTTLSEPHTDPRKIMGYFAQPQAVSLLSSAAPNSIAYELVKTAQHYAAQFPSSNMKEIVGGIEERMADPPPARPVFVFTPPAGPVAPPTPLQVR